MYRFRPIESLLGKYQELEQQEIYFASPAELNDPMEGLRDIFWTGDAIVWRNLIIHYSKSLDRIFFQILLNGGGSKLDENHLPGMHDLIGYPTESKKKLTEEIIEQIFTLPLISKLPDQLAQRKSPVRRNELILYLNVIHFHIIAVICEVYFKHGLGAINLGKISVNQEAAAFYENLPAVTALMEEQHPEKSIERFFAVMNISHESEMLNRHIGGKGIPLLAGLTFMIEEFMSKYVSKLEKDIFPPWYTASFLSECSNSAVWGHYGDNHRGVCLKFKTIVEDEKQTIQLRTNYGINESGPIIGMRPHTFHKVKYDTKPQQIDFFRSIGRIPKMQLNAMWYEDASGNTSICGEHLADDKEDAWGKTYWDSYLSGLVVKLKEWEYEKEFRLIVHGDFMDYSKSEDRKLNYDFANLEAIIFGIKTSKEDQVSILKIIEQKCKLYNRKSFDFYQAYYASDTGMIETVKVDLLKESLSK